jgi:hypothetical protein
VELGGVGCFPLVQRSKIIARLNTIAFACNRRRFLD